MCVSKTHQSSLHDIHNRCRKNDMKRLPCASACQNPHSTSMPPCSRLPGGVLFLSGNCERILRKFVLGNRQWQILLLQALQMDFLLKIGAFPGFPRSTLLRF